MRIQNLKREFYFLRQAFLVYHKGCTYAYNKYIAASRIRSRRRPIERPITNQNLSLHVLTGKKDITMLLWSLSSLYTVMREIGELHVHDDGTLEVSDRKILSSFFPSVKIHAGDALQKRFWDSVQRYPTISQLRFNNPDYVLLKKIIDPYFLSYKPIHLIVDSDLVWFRTPVVLQNAILSASRPNFRPLMMYGNPLRPSYVYFKDGTVLDEKKALFNSGIVLYTKDTFDLAALEQYMLKIDLSNFKNRHFIEQAGFTYCLKNVDLLPTNEYFVKSRNMEHVTVKHYTNPRRSLFYIEGIPWIKKHVHG